MNEKLIDRQSDTQIDRHRRHTGERERNKQKDRPTKNPKNDARMAQRGRIPRIL